MFGDKGQSFFLKPSSFYSPGSYAKRKIKLRAGTRDGAADMRNGHDISLIWWFN